MTTLENLWQSSFLSPQQLARSLRLPPQSIECMERNEYPFHRIDKRSRALIEAGLQYYLQTDLTLSELLSEA